MHTTHSALAFFVLLAGFFLLLSKMPVLVILGVLLVLGGLYAPYYESQVRRVINRKQMKTDQLKQTKSAEKKGQASANVGNILSASRQKVWVAEATAKGNIRAVIASAIAISELKHSTSNRTGSIEDQEKTIPLPALINVNFSGDSLTKEEIEQAKDLIKSEFPGSTIKDISETATFDTEIPEDARGIFRIRLEASDTGS